MIRFSCRACGKGVRVPDTSAGKKGRCPFCKEVMSIPADSQPVSLAEALAGLGAGEPVPVEQAPPPRPPSSLEDLGGEGEGDLDLSPGTDPSSKTDKLEPPEE